MNSDPRVRIPLTLSVRKGAPPDPVLLVNAMLKSLNLEGGFRLRIRGQVGPREGFNNTVVLNPGHGVRLAVQNRQNICHECHLNSKLMRANHLRELLEARLEAGCFRYEPPAEPSKVVIAVSFKVTNIGRARKKLIQTRVRLDAAIGKLASSEREVGKLRKLLASAEKRLEARTKRADKILATINDPNFLAL